MRAGVLLGGQLLGLWVLVACSHPAVTANNLPTGDVAEDGDVFVPVDVAADSAPDVQPDAQTDVADVQPDLTADVPPDVSAPQCPSTTTAVMEGDEVEPQTVLHLQCDSQNGAEVAKCVWDITQPSGSTAVLQAGANANDAIFVPNITGWYTFCPFATYNNGLMDCAIPCSKVLVVSSASIFAELTWDTPNAATATTDDPCQKAHPELHFADPKAKQADQDCDGQPDPWFDPQYDCFWWHPKFLEWGAPGGNVNPDLDNFDAGPENFALNFPAKGHTYALGVQDGLSCGPSMAKLRVFLFSEVVYDDSVVLNPLDMWFVGTIAADPAKWIPCDHGNACTSKTGSGACITPCYKPPPALSIPGEWTSTSCP